MKDHDMKKPNNLDLDSLNKELQKSLDSGSAEDKDGRKKSHRRHRNSSGMIDEFDIPIAKSRIKSQNKDNSRKNEAEKQASAASANQQVSDPANPELKKNEESDQDKQAAQTIKANSKAKPGKRIRWGAVVSRTLLGLVILLLVGAAGSAAALVYLQHKGESSMTANKSKEEIRVPEGVEKEGDLVVYKGHKYKYNNDLITVLCMGVDKRITETGPDTIGNNGAADTLVLAVLNQKTNNLSFVNISREAMVDIRQYNTKGQYTGMKNLQICLAYGYGDGHKTSCENELDAVSRLMYGMPIHAYAAMDYEGIAVLNDTIGGVTVNVLEDLTDKDPELVLGRTVTLKGNQAQTYVRSRHTALLESNELRMERQKQYMTNYVKQLIRQTRSNLITPLNVCRAGKDHIVSDIGSDGVVYLGSKVIKSGIVEGQVFSIPGEVKDGGDYAEFIPNQKKLYKMILDVFYEMVE